MTIIFDGRKFAREKEETLKEKISKLRKKPKLVSILVGNDQASVLYTKLKRDAAERVGAKFEIYNLSSNTEFGKIIKLIKKLNKDKSVNGIMVQLPLPKSLRAKTKEILNLIAKDKDVDGLTDDSPFMQATVRAVKEILEHATLDLAYFGKKAAVVGAKGMVGRGVVEMLTKMGYKVSKCDRNTRDLYAKLHEVDLVIGVTGVAGLIKGEIVKEGCIAIDVGAPRGDFDPSVLARASFMTPVPGGVGPVTVVSLLENLVEAVV